MTTNLPAEKPVDALIKMMNAPSVQAQFENALKDHKDLFVASVIEVYNSGLKGCTPASIISEALKAAVLHLPISKTVGHAYLVPYNRPVNVNGSWEKVKEAQFQIGYKGLIQLAQRSGKMSRINSGVIYKGEIVDVDKLTGETRILGKQETDEEIGYFAYFRLLNGFEKTSFWTREQVIEHAERYSHSYMSLKKDTAWKTNFSAMAIKTVMKQLFSKYAPLSIEMISAIEYDNPKTEQFENREPELIKPPENLPPTKFENHKAEYAIPPENPEDIPY